MGLYQHCSPDTDNPLQVMPATTMGITVALYFDALSLSIVALIFSLIGYSMVDQLCLDVGFSGGLSKPWFLRPKDNRIHNNPQ